MKADERCAARKGCSEWVVLAAHERGTELRARRDPWGERVYTTMAQEADRLFTTPCEDDAEACRA